MAPRRNWIAGLIGFLGAVASGVVGCAAADAEIAYVDDSSGSLFRSRAGVETALDVLDTLSVGQTLVIPANSSVRVCHYAVGLVFVIGGPVKALVTETGLVADNGQALPPSTQSCNRPSLSVVQGGVVFRETNSSGALKVSLRPRIRLAIASATQVKSARIVDFSAGETVALFERMRAIPQLAPDRLYRIIVDLQGGETRSLYVRTGEGDVATALIVIVR